MRKSSLLERMLLPLCGPSPIEEIRRPVLEFARVFINGFIQSV
jgi:hypothetical protein